MKYFFTDNIQYVKNLLIRLDERRDIPNWSNQGLILLDYIDISEKVRFSNIFADILLTLIFGSLIN